MLIISGIQPGNGGGAGRLMAHLQSEARRHPSAGIRFVFGKDGGPSVKAALAARQPSRVVRALYRRIEGDLGAGYQLHRCLRCREPVVIFHPQSLGIRRCLAVLRERTADTWLYLLDASFFCVRSYNSIPGEWTACTRCVGGHWDQAVKWRCRPFPGHSRHWLPFLKALQASVRHGRVRLLYQCDSQRRLALAHFGPAAKGAIVGMWADFDDACRQASPIGSADASCPIVFHGTPSHAKGMDWAIALAAHCPDYTFLFPFLQPSGRGAIPLNCRFEPMRWETGLSECIATAPLVLVPSLWSAPVEGALVKSIASGRMTAVVEQAAAYVTEIPDALVLKLPPDPERAADSIRHWFAEAGNMPADLQTDWYNRFAQANRHVLANIMDAVHPF